MTGECTFRCEELQTEGCCSFFNGACKFFPGAPRASTLNVTRKDRPSRRWCLLLKSRIFRSWFRSGLPGGPRGAPERPEQAGGGVRPRAATHAGAYARADPGPDVP